MEERKAYEKVAYNRQYNEKNYDRIGIMVPKGERNKIKAAADAAGLSVNAYISKAIAAQMERDGIQDTEE